MRILHQAQSSRVMVANVRENNNHLNHGSKIEIGLQLDCHGSRIVVNMTPKKRWTGVTEGEGGGVAENKPPVKLDPVTDFNFHWGRWQRKRGWRSWRDFERRSRGSSNLNLFIVYIWIFRSWYERSSEEVVCFCWPELFYCRLSSALHHLYSC